MKYLRAPRTIQGFADGVCTAATAAVLGLGIWTALAGAAHAQAVPAIPSASGLIPNGVTVTVGAIALSQPTYPGAKSTDFYVLPTLSFGGGLPGPLGAIDLRNADDISIGLFRSGAFQMGPTSGVRLDRDQSDSLRLYGMGNIHGGLLAGWFARYDFGPFYIRGSAAAQVTGDDTGGQYRMVVGSDYQLTQTIKVHGFGGLDFGDSTYNQTYFGVSAAQSLNSGLAVYRPGGGINAVRVGASTDLQVIPTWTLTAGVEYLHYTGGTSHSPLLEDPDQFRFKVGVSKTFTVGLGQ